MNAGRRTGRWTILLLLGAAASLPVAASGANAAVSIKNTAFDPRNVSVGVGERVVWTNEDDIEHTVTSSDFDSNPNCPAPLLQDCMGKGETFQHTFDEPGEFQYRCKIHASMTGVVAVGAADAEVTTTTVATTATTQAPTTSSTASTTTTTRVLATSSTLPSSTTSTTVPAESSTTVAPNEAPAFDPDDEGDGDGGSAAPAPSGGGGGSGTVAVIVAALLAVAGGGGVLLWRLRPRPTGGPPAG
ncbi:MAG: cupredoxin domain-containing protein [Acidimicrobiia bacterium]